MTRPSCPTCCTHPLVTKEPFLTEEVSGYRYCRQCSFWYSKDGNKVINKEGKAASPFDFSATLDEDPSNPGRYLNSVQQKFIENSIRGFYKDCKIRTKEEVTHLIYRLAEIYDVVPGRVRIIYDRTRKHGYGFTDRPRTL